MRAAAEPEIRERPSPNHGPRRGGIHPDLVVLHYTAMKSADAALERLCDPAAEVSCHYLIGADGTVWRLVDEAERAWHAGHGAWGDCQDVNSRSIGIELDNDGRSPFPERQMAALEGLLAGVMARWSVPPERVIGHSDMAPSRKADPGGRFDWRRLALGGLSVWPEAAEPGDFWRDLGRIGYPEADHALLLTAFRMRFRPGGAGRVSDADAALAADLAARFPVDRGSVSA